MKNSFYKSMAVGFFLMALSLTGYSQLLPTEVQLAGTFEFGGSDDSFTKSFGVFASSTPSYIVVKVYYQRGGDRDIPVTVKLSNFDESINRSVNVSAGSTESEKPAILVAAAINSTCARPWKLEVIASNGNPPADVSGRYEIYFDDPSPITTTLPSFGVFQRGRGSQPLYAPVTPGDWTITATWDSTDANPFDGSDPEGLKLRFTLLRNGRQVGEPSTGYAQNALFGHASPKMALRYRVTAADLEGQDTWAIRVTGSSQGHATNVKVTAKLAPRCQ